MQKRILGYFSIVICSILLTGCWDMGDGEKIGSITRLQRTGVFCKTWEGIIQRGGINNGSGVMGGEFHFTIENDELAQKVKIAMETQQEVKITYKKEGITFCRSDSNNYFLTKIEYLNGVAMPPKQSPEIIGIIPNVSDTTQEILKQNQAILTQQMEILKEMQKKTQK